VPTQRKTLVGHLIDRYRVGVRRACEVVRQSRSAWYYQSRENEDAPLLRRIEEIAAARVRYGFWRIFVLLRREGWKANHKRVYRLYCQAGLNLRRKRPRRRKAAAQRLERTVLTASNQVWSMDFMADTLFDGRRFRALTIVDNFTKESLANEVDQQLKGEDVVAVMERLRHQPDLPQRIQTDNGSEFVSIIMDRWAYDHVLFATGQADRQPVHRIIQRQLPRRVPQHPLVPIARRSPPEDRKLKGRLQSFSGALFDRGCPARRVRRPIRTLTQSRIFQFCPGLMGGGGRGDSVGRCPGSCRWGRLRDDLFVGSRSPRVELH